MQIITLRYGGSQTRSLTPSSPVFAGVVGDSNATKIQFRIPSTHSEYTKTIRFNIEITDELGTRVPTYFLDEDDSIVIPPEVVNQSEHQVPINLIFSTGTDVVETSLPIVLSFVNTDKSSVQSIPIDIATELATKAYIEADFSIDAETDRPQIVFSTLSNAETPIVMQVPYLDDNGKILSRFISNTYYVNFYKIADPSLLVTLTDATAPDFAQITAGAEESNIYILTEDTPTVRSSWTLIWSQQDSDKLAGIEAGAQVNTVNTVNGQTGDVQITKADVGLGNADNTSDLDKPISDATQTALNDEAGIRATADTTLQGNIDTVSGGLATHISDVSNPHAVTKAQVGLSNADNTSDMNKPISTATQTALTNETNTRADADITLQNNINIVSNDLSSHISDTSNPHDVTKAQVGLSNVDNTSDMSKPISTATQTALNTTNSNVSALSTRVTTVEGDIDTLDSELSDETSTRQSADSTLQDNIAAEAGIRAAADTTLQGNINVNTSTISNHVSNESNPHSVTKAQVGLSNADNTSDLDKPISTATQTALNEKVNIITGKGLSTNDYTTADKNKLAGIQTGAEVNINADWNATSGDAQILNKPILGTAASCNTGVSAGNVPILNSNGQLADSVIPPLAIGEYLGEVDTKADLTSLVGQKGDIAKVSADPVIDNRGVYWLADNDHTIITNWIQIIGPGSVITVNGQSGVVVLDYNDVGALESNFGTANVGKYLKVASDGSVILDVPSSGVELGNLPGVDLGTSSAGTAGTAARSDHVHNMPTKIDIGLSNVDNTSDANKPVSTAQATAISSAVSSEADIRASADNGLTLALETTNSQLQTHVADTDNPHEVTKAQVGLGSVDNTPDSDKPVSTAQQTAITNAISAEATLRTNADSLLRTDIDANATSISDHIADVSNPHAVTKAQVGLSNADNTSDVNKPVSTAQQTAITNAVSSEATLRSNADTTLQNNIDTKVTANANIVANSTALMFPSWDVKGLVTGNVKTALEKSLSLNGTAQAIFGADDTAISFFAPTTAGTAGQYLVSATGSPSWVTASTSPTSGSTALITSGAVYTALASKAPISHASTASTYGLGTATAYGHVKVIDGLTATAFANGEALSSYQGKVLNGLISSEASTRASADATLQEAIDAKQSSVLGGTGISIGEDGVTINHTNAIAAGSRGSATAAVTIQYDSEGHITGLTTTAMYPPTTSGTSGQYWCSDGNAQGIWKTFATSPVSGDTTGITSGAVFTAISSESSARSSADSTLQNNITAEASARTSADNTLQSNITAEAEAREGADATLQTNINAKQDPIVGGTGITVANDGVTINHTNSVSAGSVGSSTAIPVLTVDGQGHISAKTTVTVYPPTTVGTAGQYWRSDGVGQGVWTTPATTPSTATTLITATAVNTALASKQDKMIVQTNTTVSSWSADTTYADFGYRAAIAISGVTASDYVDISWNVEQAISGDYSPVCESYAGGVYVYSKLNVSITLPTIIIFKG